MKSVYPFMFLVGIVLSVTAQASGPPPEHQRNESSVSTKSAMKVVSADQAAKIAQEHLLKQSWAEDYLLDSVEVVEAGEVWEVFFKHVDWQRRRPGRGLIRVHKITGKPEWVFRR